MCELRLATSSQLGHSLMWTSFSRYRVTTMWTSSFLSSRHDDVYQFFSASRGDVNQFVSASRRDADQFLSPSQPRVTNCRNMINILLLVCYVALCVVLAVLVWQRWLAAVKDKLCACSNSTTVNTSVETVSSRSLAPVDGQSQSQSSLHVLS